MLSENKSKSYTPLISFSTVFIIGVLLFATNPDEDYIKKEYYKTLMNDANLKRSNNKISNLEYLQMVSDYSNFLQHKIKIEDCFFFSKVYIIENNKPDELIAYGLLSHLFKRN